MATQEDDDAQSQPCKCPSLTYSSLPSNMYLAAKNGDIKKVRQFIENGNDINSVDGDGYTLLSSACVGGQTKVVRFLHHQLYLHRNTADWAGDTPLMFAAMMGHADVVKELVTCPHMCCLDVDARNNYEETALNLAISAGHAEVEQILKKVKLPPLPDPGDFKAERIPVKSRGGLFMLRFECQVCLEEYNPGERRARSLSCGHSVCTSCVAGILKIGQLACPLCRKVHSVQVIKPEDVPVNYAVDSVIQEFGL